MIRNFSGGTEHHNAVGVKLPSCAGCGNIRVQKDEFQEAPATSST